MDQDQDLLVWVRKQLHARRGQWRQISQDSGVPYFTISKVSTGATPNPGWKTVRDLARELRRLAAADNRETFDDQDGA